MAVRELRGHCGLSDKPAPGLGVAGVAAGPCLAERRLTAEATASPLTFGREPGFTRKKSRSHGLPAVVAHQARQGVQIARYPTQVLRSR